MTDTSWQKPAPQAVWRAIDIYLAQAYDASKGPPLAVRMRLETLRSMPDESFYDGAVLEHGGEKPGETPRRYALRLGNRFYPHMKLVIDQVPGGTGYLLRADTHDSHCQPPPGSPEQAAYGVLCLQNRTIAESIEAAWEASDLPTFKKFLRDDLARRVASSNL